MAERGRSSTYIMSTLHKQLNHYNLPQLYISTCSPTFTSSLVLLRHVNSPRCAGGSWCVTSLLYPCSVAITLYPVNSVEAHTSPSPISQVSILPLVANAAASATSEPGAGPPPHIKRFESVYNVLHSMQLFISSMASFLYTLFARFMSIICHFFISLVYGVLRFFSISIDSVLTICSSIYYYAVLCCLPSHYSPRLQTLTNDVHHATLGAPGPWEDVQAATDNVRDNWQAFHRSLTKERELMTGACGVVCG